MGGALGGESSEGLVQLFSVKPSPPDQPDDDRIWFGEDQKSRPFGNTSARWKLSTAHSKMLDENDIEMSPIDTPVSRSVTYVERFLNEYYRDKPASDFTLTWHHGDRDMSRGLRPIKHAEQRSLPGLKNRLLGPVKPVPPNVYLFDLLVRRP